jgi:formimidoylglutamate deiminase
MAGLTERRGPDPRDSFWTWRQQMFRFLDRLTPDDVQAITAFVQMEMQEAGFASVGEFHYLHHASGGQAYADPAEMSTRICAAAAQSGIGLTLLPVLYQVGGRDGRTLTPGQIRFGHDPDSYARLVQDCNHLIRALPADTQLGIAPHSLRAVTDDGLRAAVSLAQHRPIHMHLAEQLAEVDELLAHTGARPVTYLLDRAEVTQQWCLIHCTQMTPAETRRLARTGAIAGLCPITEASLGDGIFDAPRYLTAGGRFGIGSDSNIRISLSEELRSLDYSQRLRDHSRAALATADRSTGRRLLEDAAKGGAQAMARGAGRIAVGEWADFVGLAPAHTDLIGKNGDHILDTLMVTGDKSMIRDLWCAGRHMVRSGRHIHRAAITRAYRATLNRLKDAM